ncbi:MAG: SGNH/GDSL hydrolase family protein [Terriglobia bacterium]
MLKRLNLVILIVCLIFAFSAPGWCQLATESNAAQEACCRNSLARGVARTLDDWAQLGRYAADDARLEAQPAQAGRIVFMGDSITDFWSLATYFPGKPYVNRGISGQTTPQMLVRMFPDVIDLHPAAVIILAGTNDIAGNTGPETAKMIEENFQAMTELAQAHGIKVILCSLTPVSDYTKYKQTAHRPPADIMEINQWIRAYATKAHAVFADYYAATVDNHGMYTEAYSRDGLHPNDQGYKVLAPVAEAAIEKALEGSQ